MLNPGNIAQITNPNDFVAVFPNDGHARNTLVQEDCHRVADSVIRIDSDHVCAGHHDFSHDGVAKLKDRMEKFAVFVFEHVLVCDLVHPVPKLVLAGDSCFGAATRRHDIAHHDQRLGEGSQSNADQSDKASEEADKESGVSHANRPGT